LLQVFMKYKIYPEKRADYLRTMEDIKRGMTISGAKEYLLFESIEEENSFVELFQLDNYKQFEVIKRKRSGNSTRPEDSFWYLIDDYVVGGRAGITASAYNLVDLGASNE